MPLNSRQKSMLDAMGAASGIPKENNISKSLGAAFGGDPAQAEVLKKKLLEMITQQEPTSMSKPMLPPQPVTPPTDQENRTLSTLANTRLRNADSERSNEIDRLKGENEDLESMSQFGDKDATDQLVNKKEALRRLLLNNR